MAVPKGIYQFEGTIDGLTVYHHKLYGMLMRRKGGPDPEKMKTDKRFERVRENGSEFGACGKAAGLVRRTLRNHLKVSGDAEMTGRLTKTLMAIKNLDTVSARGKRNIAMALMDPAGRATLNGFDFNINARLRDVLKIKFTFKAGAGTITIEGLVPKQDLNAPKGATHVRLRSMAVYLDLKENQAELSESAARELKLDKQSSRVSLKAPGLSQNSECTLYVLQITFYQVVNGQEYALPNAGCNAMGIVGVVI